MADIANDGLIFHLFDMVGADDVFVAGGGNVDVGFMQRIFNRGDFKPFHAGLQRANRVDLGDEDAGAKSAHGVGATLADVAVSAHNNHFARDHNVRRALDAVRQRLAAAVQVIEFRLGDRVVNVDRREQQRPVALHFVEAVDASGGFFRHAFHFFDDVMPTVRVVRQLAFQQRVDNRQLAVVGRFVENGRVFFGLIAAVN